MFGSTPCFVSCRSSFSAMFVTIWMCTQEWSLISIRVTALTLATCHHAFSWSSSLTRSISRRSLRLPRSGTRIRIRATACAGVSRASRSASSDAGCSIRSSVPGSSSERSVMGRSVPLLACRPVEARQDLVARAAGFWRRFVATLIDGILLSVVGGILRVVHVPPEVSALLSLAYFTFFHGRTGQTPGDAALGLRVVDIETGNVIGYGRAALRWLVSIVSTIVLLLGFFWMLWDPRR